MNVRIGIVRGICHNCSYRRLVPDREDGPEPDYRAHSTPVRCDRSIACRKRLSSRPPNRSTISQHPSRRMRHAVCRFIIRPPLRKRRGAEAALASFDSRSTRWVLPAVVYVRLKVPLRKRECYAKNDLLPVYGH